MDLYTCFWNDRSPNAIPQLGIAFGSLLKAGPFLSLNLLNLKHKYGLWAHRIDIILGLYWHYAKCWHYTDIILVSLYWHYTGIILALYLHYIGIILTLYWYYAGIIIILLVLYCHYTEIILVL